MKFFKKNINEQLLPGINDPEAIEYYSNLTPVQKAGVKYAAPSLRNELIKTYQKDNQSVQTSIAKKISGGADIALTPITKWIPNYAGVGPEAERREKMAAKYESLVVSNNVDLPQQIDYCVAQCLFDPSVTVLKSLQDSKVVNKDMTVNANNISNTPEAFYACVAQTLSTSISITMDINKTFQIRHAIIKNQKFRNNAINVLIKNKSNLNILNDDKNVENMRTKLENELKEYKKKLTALLPKNVAENFDKIINRHYRLLNDDTIAPSLTKNSSSTQTASSDNASTRKPDGTKAEDYNNLPDERVDPAVDLPVLNMGSKYDGDISSTQTQTKTPEEQQKEKETQIANLQNVLGAGSAQAAQAKIAAKQKELGLDTLDAGMQNSLAGAGVIIGAEGGYNIADSPDMAKASQALDSMSPKDRAALLKRYSTNK